MRKAYTSLKPLVQLWINTSNIYWLSSWEFYWLSVLRVLLNIPSMMKKSCCDQSEFINFILTNQPPPKTRTHTECIAKRSFKLVSAYYMAQLWQSFFLSVSLVAQLSVCLTTVEVNWQLWNMITATIQVVLKVGDPGHVQCHHICIIAKQTILNRTSWGMIRPFISKGWWSDRNLERSRMNTRDKSETLFHLWLTQSKGSLNRLLNIWWEEES